MNLKELAKLKEQLKYKVWEPKEGGAFWVLKGSGSPVFAVTEKEYIKEGNCLEASKQAEYNRVRKYVKAYSDPVESNIMYYNYLTKEIVFNTVSYVEEAFQIYASSKQVLKDAMIYSAGSEEEFARIVFGIET